MHYSSIGWVAALGLLAQEGHAFAFAPPEHETQRSGLERHDGQLVRHHRTVAWTPPGSAQAAWKQFLARYPDAQWRAQWDADTAVPTRIYGRGVAAPGATRSPDRAAEAASAFLFGHLDLLAPGSEPSDFELVANDFADGSELRTVAFTQRYRGLSVRGGQMSVRIQADRLFVVASEARPRIALETAVIQTLDREQAHQEARGWVAEDGLRLDQTHVLSGPHDPFILPLIQAGGTVDYRLVREVVVEVKTPWARWSVFLDASSGAPVAREQTLRFFDATLRLDVPDRYPQQGRKEVPARSMNVSVGGVTVRTNDAGRFTWAGSDTTAVRASPIGQRVRVVNRAGTLVSGDFTATSSATLVWDRSEEELADAQLSAYFGADAVSRYVLNIAPQNRFVRDEQVVAEVNRSDLICNAVSDSRDIFFFRAGTSRGQRCANTALLHDVVNHEFGHSVHGQSLIRGVGAFDGALSEGLSDYLAATMVNDPGMGRGFFETNQPLRDIDPPNREARWPEDVSGSTHNTGLIYGGALWDLRKALVNKLGSEAGVARTDFLWYEALRRASDIPSTFVEILAADDDDGDLTNGSPNYCEIIDAFERHGLVDPVSSSLQIGEATRTGFEVSVPVATGSIECPGLSLDRAELVWQLRSEPETGGRIPLARSGQDYSALIPEAPEGVVVQYRVEFATGQGVQFQLPDNPADPFYEFYVGELENIYCTDFEENPWEAGWSHELVEGQNNEGADDWMWGEPAGVGRGDPGFAFSGTQVVGNDLGGGNYNGNYQPNKVNQLNSPVIDVGGFSEVRLQYRRWLNIEDGFYDQADIFANGEAVWNNLDTGRNGDTHHEDKEWRFHDVDLSAPAAAGEVQVTFRMSSDQGLHFGGWTIDDFCIAGRRAPICGNGELELGEACDDGNDIPGDGCEADCTLTPPPPEPVCGNGRLEDGETCDDGNVLDGDGCEADCTLTPAPELCRDGSEPPCEEVSTPSPTTLLAADDGCGCSAAHPSPPARSLGWAGLLIAGLLLRSRRSRPE